MKDPAIAILAVICNVLAQISMKHSGKEGISHIGLSSWLNLWLLIALVLYGVSFILTVRIFAVNSLSVASPAMAGATFLLIAIASWLVFGEHLSIQRIFGMAMIVGGIVLLVRH